MEILKITDSDCNFIVEGQGVNPEELTRDHLLWILNSIYSCENLNDVIMPSNEEIEIIKNPIKKEIVKKILDKIREFKNNVVNLKNEIEDKFPKIVETN